MAMKLSLFLLSLPLLTLGLPSGEIGKGKTLISLVEEGGKIWGFRLKEGKREIATIYWDSLRAMYPARWEKRGNSLIFEDFRTDGSFTLKDGMVRITFSSLDDYPEIHFRLEIGEFDPKAWEEKQGKIPLHFLACSLPSASIFQGGGGWAIATPNIDPYPFLGISPQARKIASEWSENWSYAPSIASHALPVAGLWHPDRGIYVGYAFFESRLKGEPPPRVGMSYCWRSKRVNDFLTLVLPYAKPHRVLRYPRNGDVYEGHFTLLYSTSMPSDADPNAFCIQFAWRRYRELMPAVPDYTDLSWLPTPYRVKEFHHPPYARLLGRHPGDSFIKPGSLLGYGTSWLWSLDYFYEKRDKDVLSMLHEDLAQLERYAQRFKVGGDECVYWRWPIEGDWQDFWGKGVPTLHNIHGVLCALAFLDAYRNERDPRYLPYIDGTLLWLKHILYTRNCYPDVPDGMFAWDSAPFATFCIKYADTFRRDKSRGKLVQLAERLTRSLVYRCLAMFNSDNDPYDNIDSSWMMGGNAGEFWIGIGSANELWEMTAGVLLAYLASGDPILGQYVRGILERWHWLFREAPHKSVLEWGNEFAEIWALTDSVPNYEKNERSTFGGLWGGLEQLIYPPYGSKARVVCRQKASMVFNVDGIHTTISHYRADEDANFSFRVHSKLSTPFALALTWPFVDLRHKIVRVNGKPAEAFASAERPDTLIVRNVRDGAIIEVGEQGKTKSLSSSLAKERSTWSPFEINGFSAVDIHEIANVRIKRDWLDNSSWAGYEGGLKWILGVPFVLIEPGWEDHPVGFEGEMPLKLRGQFLFALLGHISPRSRFSLQFSDGTSLHPDLQEAVKAIEAWPPCFEWSLSLLAVPLPSSKEVRRVEVRDCILFALTKAEKEAPLELVLSAMEEQRKANEEIARVKEVGKEIAEYLRRVGKSAVLPLPPGHSNTPPRVFYPALKEGLLHFLTPEEFVDERAFNAKRFPILFIFGDEHYIQTVKEEGDGDRALIRYLREGGKIVSLSTGPTPCAYNEKGELISSFARFGFTLDGLGGTQPPSNPQAYAPWEKPPQGEEFFFRRNPHQNIVTQVPDVFPFYESGDQRWRPMGNFWRPGEAEYIPLISLYDGKGNYRGDGAVVVRFKGGPLEGGQVVYIWFRLWQDKKFGPLLIRDIVREISGSEMD